MRHVLTLAATLGVVLTASAVRADDAKPADRLDFAPLKDAKEGDWTLRVKDHDICATNSKLELVLVQVAKAETDSVTLKTTREVYDSGKRVGEPAVTERKIDRAETSIAKLLDLDPKTQFKVSSAKMPIPGKQLTVTSVEYEVGEAHASAYFSKELRLGIGEIGQNLCRPGQKCKKAVETVVGQGTKDDHEWGEIPEGLRVDLEQKTADTAKAAEKAAASDDEKPAPPKRKHARPEPAQQKTVSVVLGNDTLETAVSRIASALGVNAPVVVDPKLTDVRISLRLADAAASEAWDMIEDFTGCEVTLRDGKIHVTKKP